MNETEVRNIFVEQLTGQNTKEGITRAYYAVSLHILDKLAKPWAELSHWELLKQNTYAKSRLCIFLGIKPGAGVRGSEIYLENLLFIYKHWLKVTVYLDDNYEVIDSSIFKRLWAPYQLSDLRDILKDKYEVLERQFLEKRVILFNAKELPVADQMFNILYLVILGEDLFSVFLQEFNQALEVLRKYQQELNPIQ